MCDSIYPTHSFPRGVAGESVATGVIKCSLKPIDWADYPVTFTASSSSDSSPRSPKACATTRSRASVRAAGRETRQRY